MKAATNTVSLLLDVGKIIRTRMARELPLSLTKSETLRLLEQEKSLSMRAIAAHFKITAPSATSLVNELVAGHLVSRSENAEDRREVLLHLTAQGKKMLHTISIHRKKIVTEILSVLSEQDKKHLDTILGKILVEIESR